jgi:hypothetical protein
VLGFSTRLPSDAAFSRLCKSLPEMLSLTVDDGPESASLPLSRSQLSCLEICTHLTRLDLRSTPSQSLIIKNQQLSCTASNSSKPRISECAPYLHVKALFREDCRVVPRLRMGTYLNVKALSQQGCVVQPPMFQNHGSLSAHPTCTCKRSFGRTVEWYPVCERDTPTFKWHLQPTHRILLFQGLFPESKAAFS